MFDEHSSWAASAGRRINTLSQDCGTLEIHLFGKARVRKFGAVLSWDQRRAPEAAVSVDEPRMELLGEF